MKTKKGFTLVELLAVIVVLAIILVIAGISVTNTINKSRKSAFALSIKTLRNSVKERIKMKNMNIDSTIECTIVNCSDIYEYSNSDYEMNVSYDNGIYSLVILGKGVFSNMNYSTEEVDGFFCNEGTCIATVDEKGENAPFNESIEYSKIMFPIYKTVVEDMYDKLKSHKFTDFDNLKEQLLKEYNFGESNDKISIDVETQLDETNDEDKYFYISFLIKDSKLDNYFASFTEDEEKYKNICIPNGRIQTIFSGGDIINEQDKENHYYYIVLDSKYNIVENYPFDDTFGCSEKG